MDDLTRSMTAGARLHTSSMGTMSEDFDLEIRHRKGSYLIVARAYGVAVRSQELEAGIREAIARIAAVDQLYREAEVEPMSLQGSCQRRSHQRSTTSGLARLADHLPPALVTGVVLSALLLLASVPIFSAAARLAHAIEGVSSLGAGSNVERFGHDTINLLVRVGATMDKVTPARKAELRLAVRRIMQGLSPLIEEVGDSVGHDPSPTQPPAR